MRRIIATLCCSPALAIALSACATPEDSNSRSNVAPRPEAAPMPALPAGRIAVPPPSADEAMAVPAPGTSVTVVTPPATAAVPLTAREVVGSLTNNTVSGSAPNGTPYYAYYLPNGQEHYRFGNAVDTGVWHVLPDGRLCGQVASLNGGAEQCYILYRAGNQLSIWHPGGAAETVTLLPGNPMQL